MKAKSREEVEQFLKDQKSQLGLSETEIEHILREAPEEEEPALAFSLSTEPDLEEPVAAAPSPARKAAKRRMPAMTDPYLPESQTIKARPAKVSQIRSLLYEHALPNEYIVEIGRKEVKPVLGGKFFKWGKHFLKFPATVQTVYFTSDNANKNYQGLKIDGYACWRVNPEAPELAARTLDFSDQENPMGNTNRIIRTICTEAIRHIIANITIEESLTKKDEIGRDLKGQLQRIERTWGLIFDQVGIERVTILSARVFEDLQQKTRDQLRLSSAESRMQTDQEIEKKQAQYSEEMERIKAKTEAEARVLRATTETGIHKVELDEKAKREQELRKADEDRRRSEAEATERMNEHLAQQARRQATREMEIAAHQENEKVKLALLKAETEASVRINAAAAETKITEALATNELAQAEARHKKTLREQALEAERSSQALAVEQQAKASRQKTELELAAERLAHSLKERRETILVEHEAEAKRLEHLRLEEEMRNTVSPNRVLTELTARLPEIAAAQKIDRYTVLDRSGSSPLSNLLAEIFSLLEAHGLVKAFTPKEQGGAADQ
ncbi:MAG: SPFH domain-containing protein [Thermodesulfobacteriota bacterium]